jgi:hypothetical protein
LLYSNDAYTIKNMKLWKKVPKKDSSKEIVNSIIESAAHLLEKDGPNKLSTNKIAQKAGISIGSLYQYFSNKESVLDTVMSSAADDYEKFFMDEIAKNEAKDADSFVRVLIDLTFMYLLNRKGQFKAIYDLHLTAGTTAMITKIRYRNATLIGTHIYNTFPTENSKEDCIKYIYVIQCQNFGIFHSYIYAENPPYTFDELKTVAIESSTLINRLTKPKPIS